MITRYPIYWHYSPVYKITSTRKEMREHFNTCTVQVPVAIQVLYLQTKDYNKSQEERNSRTRIANTIIQYTRLLESPTKIQEINNLCTGTRTVPVLNSWIPQYLYRTSRPRTRTAQHIFVQYQYVLAGVRVRVPVLVLDFSNTITVSNVFVDQLSYYMFPNHLSVSLTTQHKFRNSLIMMMDI